jgi:hypothetical protein
VLSFIAIPCSLVMWQRFIEARQMAQSKADIHVENRVISDALRGAPKFKRRGRLARLETSEAKIRKVGSVHFFTATT